MSPITTRRPMVIAGVAAAALAGGLVIAQSGGDRAVGASSGARVVSASGDIGPAVARFRGRLGVDNGGAPGGDPAGHREITWDAVPDAFASPHGYPSDFFNAKTAPRARGIVLGTPAGTRLRVSADADNPSGAAPRFADIDPVAAADFRAFSAQRLFAPVGGNVVNVRFRVPGTTRPAVVRGFGAVYTGVEVRGATNFEYFDVRGRSLGRYAVPLDRAGASFLGVTFAAPVVARVRVAFGNAPLGTPETSRTDVSVVDNVIYGEPVAP